MKKMFVLMFIFLLIFISCGKKKQEEAAKAKAERKVLLSNVQSIRINEAYIVNYVFENKENAVGVIQVVKIPKSTLLTFVYNGKEASAKFTGALLGIKEGEKIKLREGYVKAKGVKYKLIPLVIKTPQEFWTKSELMSWIIKYPLTPVDILSDGTRYPSYYDLSCFIESTENKSKIYLVSGPTLQAEWAYLKLFFNSKYEQWEKRPKSNK